MVAVNGTVRSVDGRTVVVAIQVGGEHKRFELQARTCQRVHLVRRRPTFHETRRRALGVGTSVVLQLGSNGGVLAWGVDPRHGRVSLRPLAGTKSRRREQVLRKLVA